MVAASGFTIKGYSTGATTYSGYWTHNTQKTGLTADANWYAQSEKAAITHTATFNPNGNGTSSLSTPTGCSKDSSTGVITCTCTRAAVYNGASQAANCSITSPTITAPSGFTVVGFNTSSTATSSAWNQTTAANVSANSTNYAITKNTTAITITFYRNGATSQTPSGGSASTANTVTASCYKYQ